MLTEQQVQKIEHSGHSRQAPGPLAAGLAPPVSHDPGPGAEQAHGPVRAGVAFRRPVGGIPPKLYRIGEVVEYSGVSRQTIHNYTTMGLIQESRWTPGGHRLYDESVFGRLDAIAEMKAQRKSLDDIRRQLAEADGP